MKRLSVIFVTMMMVVSPLTLPSCSMVSPPTVENNLSEHPSYDGNVANSGVVGVIDGRGFEVTPNFRTRYNIMVEGYGMWVAEGLRQDDGLSKMSNGNWLIDKQHMVYFLDMNQLRKNGVTSK